MGLQRAGRVRRARSRYRGRFGDPFDQFFQARIFDPLGMKDTFFYPAEGNPRLATLYRRGEKGLEKQNSPGLHERHVPLW